MALLETIQEPNDLVGVKVDGKSYSFSKKWMDALSHYEVNLSLNEMLKIRFIRSESKVLGLKCGMLMSFTGPIEVGSGYYLIPGFVHFAIRADGRIKSVRTNRVLKQSIGPYGYPQAYLYDADKKRWRGVSVHLLVARTFVKNDDYVLNPYVNHKDGNKLNHSPRNLEWVSGEDNQLHAISSGLRNDNYPCKMLDTSAGTIESFPSVGRALKAAGLKSGSATLSRSINGQLIPNLFSGRYEIKLDSEERGWFYIDRTQLQSRVISRGPFQARNMATGMILEHQSMVGLEKLTGVSRDGIRVCVRSIFPTQRHGWQFREKIDATWPCDPVESKHTPKRSIRITDWVNGEQKLFDSLHQACNFLHVDKVTLKRRLASKKPLGNWVVEEVGVPN